MFLDLILFSFLIKTYAEIGLIEELPYDQQRASLKTRFIHGNMLVLAILEVLWCLYILSTQNHLN